MKNRIALYVQVYRYMITGVLAFLLDYGLYAVSAKIIFTAVSQGTGNINDKILIIANIFSSTCGFLVSFSLNRLWVFKNSGKPLKQFIRYSLLFFLNLLWSNPGLYLLIHTVHMNIFFAKFIIVGSTAIVNFVSFKNLVFISRREFRPVLSGLFHRALG